jgi:UDP:flavonoid glycosyltransferase YjiC (YdhE family)
MKILFATAPGLGHINPMLPLAVALRDALGHEVRWAVAEEYRAHLETRGFSVHPSGIGDLERWRRFGQSGAAPMVPGPPSPDLYRKVFGEICARPMFEDLRRLVAEWTPDLFVHDLNEYASAPIATWVGRPHVTHGFGAILPPANIAAAGETAAPLWAELGLAARESGGVYQHAFIDIYPEALMPAPPMPCPRLPSRPVWVEAAPPPAWWADLPERRAVYLTFGTVFNDNPATLQTAMDALAGLNINVIVTSGRDLGGAITPPSNARVFAYVPQETVLPHTAAVASHAGSGTFLGALAHGLPQVCIPRGADQFLNARLGASAGVSMTLQPDEFSAGALRDAVSRVLDDPTTGARARSVAQQIATMPTPVEVANSVDSLMAKFAG